MLRYFISRLAGLVFVLFAVTLLVHLLLHLVPGDPVEALVGQSASEADRARLRHELGLDEPFHRQYLAFLERTVHLDFGRSFVTRQQIAAAIKERFPRTLYLAMASMTIALLAGVAAGAITALYPRTSLDRGVMLAAVAGVSAPVFVVALLLRYCFAEKLPLLPPAGYGTFACVVLPALALGSRSAAYLARVTRTLFLEVMSEDFIRAARAKGLSRFAVLRRHAFPNILSPLLAVAILDFAMYLNGSVITESIFAWPGLGRYALNAIQQRDLPAVQAVVLVMAVTYVLASALTDVARAIVDPRARR